jgi:hypothetical protein
VAGEHPHAASSCSIPMQQAFPCSKHSHAASIPMQRPHAASSCSSLALHTSTYPKIHLPKEHRRPAISRARAALSLREPWPPAFLQARAAPVQRLADAVAGKFTYGVLTAAAVTFAFWAGLGPRLFPQVGGCVVGWACGLVGVCPLAWLGLAWLGLAWLGLAWRGVAYCVHIFPVNCECLLLCLHCSWSKSTPALWLLELPHASERGFVVA